MQEAQPKKGKKGERDRRCATTSTSRIRPVVGVTHVDLTYVRPAWLRCGRCRLLRPNLNRGPQVGSGDVAVVVVVVSSAPHMAIMTLDTSARCTYAISRTSYVSRKEILAVTDLLDDRLSLVLYFVVLIMSDIR